MANVVEIKTYKSNGSDGYTEGTFGWRLLYTLSNGRAAESCGGGNASRESATAEAKRVAMSLGVEVASS